MVRFFSSLANVSCDRYLRNDEKYHSLSTTGLDNIFGTAERRNVRLFDVLMQDYTPFEFRDGEEYKGIPTGQAYIDSDGDIIDWQGVTVDSCPDRLKYRITNENILISSLRLAKAPALLFEDIDFGEYVFSNGFYIFKVRAGWNKKFVLYLLRSAKIKRIIDEHIYRGIGISSYKVDDLLNLRIPFVPIEKQNAIVDTVLPIETDIKKLKMARKNERQIIDEVFAREFGFDYDTFEKLKGIKSYTARPSWFANNPDLRFSAKFHRPAGEYVMRELNRITVKKIKHFLAEPIVLGASVSPSDYDDDGEYRYISMATIKDWKFNPNIANPLSSSYSQAKIDKTVRKNDIIMARSGEGTIGKVALIENDEINGIFADFTMRIRLHGYNPQFAYFYFRTTYFQYIVEIYKKGLGNNTNIFPVVLREFPIPDISLEEQQRIVDEITAAMEAQEQIQAQISELREQIDSIITEAITQ